ncbi:C-X-C chemokine receptor type 1-like [Girardinichthys multiradiatus]|uniref:C-X-C chemokine receptor type 1-like n=1 Tax=Girardinichthys multiradiatus TaxID=208333 RepID=UPI001FAB626E|nr:C-X-C chemokine receptor type 1-like [Girardinichthys multiradiatus]
MTENYSFFYLDYYNDMDEAHTEVPAFQLCAGVFVSIVFVISMLGNSFIMWVFLRDKAWKTTSDLLLLQLTVSNLCFTATLPFAACNMLHGWIFGEWACGIFRGFLLLGLNSYAAIFTAMAFHSFVTVIQPSCLSTQNLGRHRVLISSVTIWLVSAAVSIKLAVHSYVTDPHHGFMIVCISEMQLIEVNIQIFLFFVIPFIMVTFCYLHMWINISSSSMSSSPRPSKITACITVSSLLCLTPYNILLFINSLMALGAVNYDFRGLYVINRLDFFSFILCHFCCCLSPLFQMCGTQRFRGRFKGLCSTPPENHEDED